MDILVGFTSSCLNIVRDHKAIPNTSNNFYLCEKCFEDAHAIMDKYVDKLNSSGL